MTIFSQTAILLVTGMLLTWELVARILIIINCYNDCVFLNNNCQPLAVLRCVGKERAFGGSGSIRCKDRERRGHVWGTEIR